MKMCWLHVGRVGVWEGAAGSPDDAASTITTIHEGATASTVRAALGAGSLRLPTMTPCGATATPRSACRDVTVNTLGTWPTKKKSNSVVHFRTKEAKQHAYRWILVPKLPYRHPQSCLALWVMSQLQW